MSNWAGKGSYGSAFPHPWSLAEQPLKRWSGTPSNTVIWGIPSSSAWSSGLVRSKYPMSEALATGVKVCRTSWSAWSKMSCSVCIGGNMSKENLKMADEKNGERVRKHFPSPASRPRRSYRLALSETSRNCCRIAWKSVKRPSLLSPSPQRMVNSYAPGETVV